MPPGTLADGPRKMASPLQLDTSLLPLAQAGVPLMAVPTCHTITMVATHELGTNIAGCPKCLTDASALTWTVIACPGPGTTCPPIDLMPAESNCDALFSAALGHGCPPDDEADGGKTCPFQAMDGMAQ